MNWNSKDDFVWGYGYDKVIRKINKELKELFEQREKEPERDVRIWIKLANGETIMLNEMPEFNMVNILLISAVATLCEAFSYGGIDNLTVPAVTSILYYLVAVL